MNKEIKRAINILRRHGYRVAMDGKFPDTIGLNEFPGIGSPITVEQIAKNLVIGRWSKTTKDEEQKVRELLEKAGLQIASGQTYEL